MIGARKMRSLTEQVQGLEFIGSAFAEGTTQIITAGMVRSDNRWKVLGYLYALRLYGGNGQASTSATCSSPRTCPRSVPPSATFSIWPSWLANLQIIVVPNPEATA